MLGLTALGLALVSPFISIFGALFRAVFLFWPTMILLGAVHSYIPGVPALGYAATFFVVALISILVPTGTSTTAAKS